MRNLLDNKSIDNLMREYHVSRDVVIDKYVDIYAYLNTHRMNKKDEEIKELTLKRLNIYLKATYGQI